MTTTVGWGSAADWDLFDEIPVSTVDNTLTLGATGGKGTVVAATSAGAGNDRRLFVLNDPALYAVDWECRLSYRLTGAAQTGIVMRVNQGVAPVSWANIIFGANGNVLPGCWEFDGATLAQTNQQAGTAYLFGAPIVSASGSGTAVTVTTSYEHLLTAGEIVHHDSSFGSFGQVTVASTPTATTYTFASAVAGSWTGGRYRWVIAPADRERTHACRLVGSTLTHKQWISPHPEPDWGDATTTVTQVLPSTLLGGAPLPTTKGRVGIVVAHLDDSTQGRAIHLEDFTVTSLDTTETGGSWHTLSSILAENREWRLAEASEPPEACPNDGEPLTEGPNGVLHCRHDGWTWRG